MIDWDFARPESRLFDIGWFALEWCPIGPPDVVGPAELLDQPARLRELCDAYGLGDRTGVLGAVWSRLETFIEWMEKGAAAGDPVRKKWVDEGGAVHHRRRLTYLNSVAADFAAALR